MIKIWEHWRPPYSKHELGSGDWVETPTKKWQNRSRPFNMNHKHVKTTWTINMWNKCDYRSLQHDFWEQFSKHELHSGDRVQIAKRWHGFFFSFCVFFSSFIYFIFIYLFVWHVFSVFFLFLSFFLFFLLGFAPVG